MKSLYRKVKPHYIYGLIDPRDGCLFYVGQTTNPARRLKSHNENYLKHHNMAYRCRMQAIRQSRKFVKMVILAQGTDSTIDALEIKFIKQKKSEGHSLVNIQAGGRYSRRRL